MKREFFWQAVGGIDGDLIVEADAENPRNKTNAENKARILPFHRIGAAAAVLLIVCGVGIAAAGGRLRLGMTDEAAYDAAPAETWFAADGDAAGGLLADKSESKNESPAVDDGADTDLSTEMEGIRITELYFRIPDGETWRTVTKPYPDGLPSAEGVLNDYLAAAGSKIRCVSVQITTTPSVTVTSGNIVSHTPGIRTALITLTGDPGDGALKGLLHLGCQFLGSRYYHMYTADGTELTIGDTLPGEGYDPRDFLNG